MNKKLSVCSVLVFMISVSVFAQRKPEADATLKDSVNGYHLIWHDEFDGNSINSDNWKRLVGPYDYNSEVQYYTDRDVNSYVENGKLIIKALHEHYVGSEGTREFTSARIVSQYLKDWKYGKVFVRAKLPKGIGTWPAIWMMPTESVYGGWPNSGEIDIMEHVGFNLGRIYGTIHTEAYNHRDGTQKGSNTYVPDATENFHTYSIEWTEDYIEFAVDDNPYYKFFNEYKSWREWPFDQKFYMILNIGIGGGWGGQQGIDTSAFPVKMEIDYVRVYQKDFSTNNSKYFVKHAGDNWSKHLMNDNGVDGDKIANDGIYSRMLTITATDKVKIDWVVADTLKDISQISWFYNPSGTKNILFTFDTNKYNDEFLPVTNILNTDEKFDGNFTVVIKGQNDTLRFSNQMTDDGNLLNGDKIAGDKIYSLHKQIATPGNYIWYVHHNIPSWAEGARWSEQGKISSWNDMASVKFSTDKENQDVYFYLDVNAGRVATVTDTVFTLPDKAEYYFSLETDGWNLHKMYDDGTHGDLTSDDGIYSFLQTVEETSNQILRWKVTDTSGVVVAVPSWFYNSSGTKDILFTFDSHKYRDGRYPEFNILNSNEQLPDNFTLVLKNETGAIEFPGEMTDDGNINNGDSTANDKVFSLRKTVKKPGVYSWFIYLDNSVDNKARWTHFGKIISVSDLHSNQLVTIEENQGVNFYLNLNTGRISAKVDEPSQPPQYMKFVVKHDGDGWKDHLMHDDGLFGDKIANDGVYSRLLTIATNKQGKNDWAINDGNNQQVGTISWFYNPSGTNDILFTLDTKIYNDGWYPKTNIKNTDEVKILQGPYGLNLDTVAYNNIFTDDGDMENGDSTAGDHIFSVHKVIKNPGKHKWFVYYAGFDFRRWDANGKQNGWEGAFPDTLDFETTVPNQDVYFYLNVNTGRVTVKSDSQLVSVKNEVAEFPKGFELLQNYPNPFNPTTTIEYSIPSSSVIASGAKQSQEIISVNSFLRNDVKATLKVYDILGREVATLVNQKQQPGNYKVEFNASKLSSGIYFYKLKVGGYTKAKNMILLK